MKLHYINPVKSIGITGTSTSLFTTGVFGVVKTVGALFWAFVIIDKFGRRGILLVGSVGGALAMYAIAGSYCFSRDPPKAALIMLLC